MSYINFLVLDNVHPERNMARFYVLSVEETLFGDSAVVRRWGRIGTTGRQIIQLFANHEEAVETLEHWFERKKARGYTVRFSE